MAQFRCSRKGTKTIIKYSVNATKAAAADSTETSTGIVLPAGTIVFDAWIVVKTADAGETVSFGTDSTASGDADGFGALVSLATAGFVYPGATVTVGGTETYYSANTRGALLSDYIVGTNAGSDFGLYHAKPYKVGADAAITFTTSSGTDTAVFDIYVEVMQP